MSYVPDTHLLFKEVDGKLTLAVSYSQMETFLQCPYKWYRTYILGERSTEKQEATSYGTVIHRTLEYFFRNRKLPTGKDLGDAISYYYSQENVPWESPEHMLEALRQGGELLAWIVELFERDGNGKYVRDHRDLNPAEKLIRYGKVVGVEENFNLPYKLPGIVDINGIEFDKVNITGSVDLHLAMTDKEGKEHHYVIDWKSGRKLFDKEKLENNLQHPIYAAYVLRMYREGLPDVGLYFFTRTREYQKVTVDKKRLDKSVEIMNGIFSKMYGFERKTVESYLAYRERSDKSGYARYKIKLDEPTTENQRPCPSALCYFCDFGMHKRGVCPYSSDWDLSKKKNK